VGIPLKLKPSSPLVSRRMSVTPQKNTAPEMALRKILHQMGMRYRVDRVVLNKPRRTADIAFSGIKIAVFIDGCFWHGCEKHGTWPKQNAAFWRQKILNNKKRDDETCLLLKSQGWTAIRIWEHETPLSAAKKIAKIVAKKQAASKKAVS